MNFAKLMKNAASEAIAAWLNDAATSASAAKAELERLNTQLDEALVDGADDRAISDLREKMSATELELRRLRVRQDRAQKRLKEVKTQEAKAKQNAWYQNGLGLQAKGDELLDQFDAKARELAAILAKYRDLENGINQVNHDLTAAGDSRRVEKPEHKRAGAGIFMGVVANTKLPRIGTNQAYWPPRPDAAVVKAAE